MLFKVIVHSTNQDVINSVKKRVTDSLRAKGTLDIQAGENTIYLEATGAIAYTLERYFNRIANHSNVEVQSRWVEWYDRVDNAGGI